jgi:hypothetical protein
VDALHVVPGDALAEDAAAVVERPVEDLVPWRDLLHDGPVPAGLEPGRLARVRAAHLASRGWVSESAALASLRERDGRVSAARRRGVEIVLWFETDLVCALALAQVADRLSGHLAPVWLVTVPNRADRNLRAAWRRRRRYQPRSEAFTALRSPDPRGWAAVPAFARLLAELPDVKTELSALERAVLAALKLGALSAAELFTRVSAQERPPWIADQPLLAVADDLAPLVSRSVDGQYAITDFGADVLAGRAVRPRVDRWLGGVHLGPGQPDWRWDSRSKRAVLASRPGVVIQEAAANRLEASPTR